MSKNCSVEDKKRSIRLNLVKIINSKTYSLNVRAFDCKTEFF